MVAGGMTFAIPGIMPEAYASHNANLFVSAENSAFSNTFGGPMVVEIVINDDNIRTLDDAHGQPDVTVNGKKVVMVQATDGNWYAYVADRNQAQLADQTQVLTPLLADEQNRGFGLDFGEFCDNDTSLVFNPAIGANVGNAVLTASDSVGVAIPFQVATATAVNGTATIEGASCTLDDGGTTQSTRLNHVTREQKTPSNSTTTNNFGQVNLNQNAWPLIQLYDFTPTGNVIIIYNKGGDVQTTTLTFDTTDIWAVLTADRNFLPQNAEVHFTITDQQLNIDPTDEDSWTFGTISTNKTTFYQIFNENGGTDADGTRGAVDVASSLSDFLFEDNGVLIINKDAQSVGQAVIQFEDNDDQQLTGNNGGTNGSSIAIASQAVTMTEMGPNLAIFANFDESDNANIDMTSAGLRGTSATIDYNDSPISFVVQNSFATLDMDVSAIGDEWNSGEEIPVTLVDQDLNLNSRADEDLDVNNPNVGLIPSLTVGSPFTLATGDSATFFNTLSITSDSAQATILKTSVGGQVTFDQGVSIDSFSQRMILDPAADIDLDMATSTVEGSALFINLGNRTVADLEAVLLDPRNNANFTGFNLFNYDLRSIDDRIKEDATTDKLARVTAVHSYLLINEGSTTLRANDLKDGSIDADITLLLIQRNGTLQSTVTLGVQRETHTL